MYDDMWVAKKLESWYRSAYAACVHAGGHPDSILEAMPKDLVILFARNNIHLKYNKENSYAE